MTVQTVVETKRVVRMEPSDVLKMLNAADITPPDWKFFSVSLKVIESSSGPAGLEVTLAKSEVQK